MCFFLNDHVKKSNFILETHGNILTFKSWMYDFFIHKFLLLLFLIIIKIDFLDSI